jgi:hypothetical protein
MAKFNGKNSTTSPSKLAKERIRYNQEAFPTDSPQVVNFNFAEKGLYGRVTRAHSPVVPSKNYIVSLITQADSPGTVSVMNFVAEQFRDFVNNFSNAFRMGLLPSQDPIFSSVEATRGYEDPAVIYDSYADNLMGLYSNTYLTKYVKDVNSFEDYLYYLPTFMEVMRDGFPITYSGFQRSSQSNIFTSGLAIDIAGVRFGDDPAKEKLILESPCFEFYLNLAKQYGFSVNKRNPGVLVSDLKSPATAPYRKKYAIPTIDSLFANQYDRTLYSDLILLEDLLIEGYNSFVKNNLIKRDIVSCGDSIKSNVSIREYITKDNINSILYNNIIKTYIMLRNIEERKPFENARINNIVVHAHQYYKISEKTMLDYIDQQFKSEYNMKDGSLTYYKKKLDKILDKKS